MRLLSSIKINAEHEIATALALRTYLGFKVQEAIQLAKCYPREIVFDPPRQIPDKYTVDELKFNLSVGYDIEIKIINT